MQFLPINPAAADHFAQPGDAVVVPVAERFQRQAAAAYVQAAEDRNTIETMAADPHTASDPALLYELQTRQEAYTKRMTLTAVMVNHMVKGVETLVKT